MDYQYQDGEQFAQGLTMIIYLVIYIPLILVSVVSMWKIFTKAGKEGWASIVPFYSTYVLVQIVGKPAWWFFLMFVPVVNTVISILIMLELAKVFGKEAAFGVGLIFVPIIFLPWLAFGKDQYVGPEKALN